MAKLRIQRTVLGFSLSYSAVPALETRCTTTWQLPTYWWTYPTNPSTSLYSNRLRTVYWSIGTSHCPRLQWTNAGNLLIYRKRRWNTKILRSVVRTYLRSLSWSGLVSLPYTQGSFNCITSRCPRILLYSTVQHSENPALLICRAALTVSLCFMQLCLSLQQKWTNLTSLPLFCFPRANYKTSTRSQA